MYLRQSKQKRADGREITYLQLAENVWDATKGRSQAQIVFNCGRADDPEVIERLRRLAKSILRRCSPEAIVAAQEALRALQVTLQTDVAQALDVTIAFNDNDGD